MEKDITNILSPYFSENKKVIYIYERNQIFIWFMKFELHIVVVLSFENLLYSTCYDHNNWNQIFIISLVTF